ncbi:pro-sigmaK processing inhibitor BofA family protein [Clostridium polynesiense]|uniref:pro-sigmaK processing inhibitor BofA family protein n=1 Tax=Clostridium polynesiense TaxID=1325933 RepID=UPI00058E1A92|nr:pro-sigmaK processing inhibitor BofA family protein [Clostridium polynesiense]
MDVFIYFIIAMVALVLIVKLFSWPIKILVKLLINGVLGAILLWLVNLFGQMFGLQIGINAATALIAGFFGVPGVIFLIIFKLFF